MIIIHILIINHIILITKKEDLNNRYLSPLTYHIYIINYSAGVASGSKALPSAVREINFTVLCVPSSS